MLDTKSQRLNLRVTDSDNQLFRQAASASEESLSEFIVESSRERAERLLADRNRFVLNSKNWAAFNAALDRAAQVRPELVELLRSPRPE